MSEKNHKLAAIIFTDVIGYTKQMEEDEHRTMQLLQRQREIVFPIVKSFDGEIVKELGDGLMMMFSSAVEAVRCAIEIQKRLKDEELTIRAGIHIGEVIFKDGDVFGSAVNVAARIEPLATKNGICVSKSVRNQIRNQGDINLESIGIKELKGIREPMEVYEVLVEGVTQPKRKGFSYILNDLWKRRVFQVLAIYLIGALLIRMVVSAYVTSNLYSPHWVQLAWIILLSLIPTVFLITYFHGYRNAGKWTKPELIGLSSNVIFSALLIFFIFNGKDLKAITTTVSIEDENGEIIEKTIVKNEFRKKSLVFFFENKSSDTSLNWIQYALPILIEYDASQDIFLEVGSAINYIDKIKKESPQDGIVTSLMLNRKIAADNYKNTFLTGSFDFLSGKYKISTKLYNTNTGKLIAENHFSGENILKIVDEINIQLKYDFELSKVYIEQSEDMPVSEIFTHSIKALEFFSNGSFELAFNNRWEESIRLFERAIEEDKSFTIGYLNLSLIYYFNNKMEKAMQSIQIVIDSKDKLPQRFRFMPQYIYCLMKNEPDNAIEICKTWAEYSPDDINPHVILASLYNTKNELNKVIHEYQIILRLDSSQHEKLRELGDFYIKKEDYDSAAYYFDKYTQKFPSNYKSLYDLGNLFIKKTEFDKARKYLDKALILEPGKIDILHKVADLEIREGNFDKAKNAYNEALRSCKSIQDSIMSYRYLEIYHETKGELTKSFEFYNKSLEILNRVAPQIMVLNFQAQNVDKYILVDKSREIFGILKTFEKELQPPNEKGASHGFLTYYIEIDNADEAEKYLDDATEFNSTYGEKSMGNIIYAKGRIAEIRNDYNSALENYQKLQELSPSNYFIYRRIAKCYRKLDKYKEGEKNISITLKHFPFNPKTNYEAAILFFEMNDKEKAKEHLNRALEVWKDADENYEPYQKALKLQRKLDAV